MPIDGRLLRKLQMLKERLESILRDHEEIEADRKRGRGHLLVDSADIDPLLERWNVVYAELSAADSEFADVPQPAILKKFDNASAYDGRGGYDTRTVRRFQLDMNEAWTLATHPGKQLSQVSIDREGIFHGGEPFDAMMAVSSIIREAKSTIEVIDAYIGDRTLQLLTMKDPDVAVRVLTHSVKPAVLAAAQAFLVQYGKLEIRTSNAFHDRFIVIDAAAYFHFGTSIKDAGVKNTFMFSRIEEVAVVASLKTGFAEAWTNAVVVSL